ncbi:2-succinyl-5-enolpyruvyl-6-hydroxy-3-cyclohexene-1-carboxylic-acid synthase [Bacillus sp. AFS017336]|uniref:2-succinyl-5-enolpyruvyl-6-hydroxy-3- cyclohexene-1-carboxylic-acid synthase n=1 Tax=Bacillus sp. AFS017336 TaxID=2033489 RepID=UPI000BF0FBB1|nr:2-succinyl-5-enolpyruvyl-6-hydroxy-3-cyclohexene-1-carboxylic-acid synthase [Bacillus sp. AFS017336]PEK99572.1 2-succinyl-5-enolpyruvyl-6-hydroxy-3-cyclohexene-1-carboxylic-acid synthase [Bacillus sp. AFS017336]
MKDNEALTKYIGALVDELSALNIQNVVISPGSRSTPISMLVNEHPKLKSYIAVDERGAGFFALGIAKSTKQPTVLICTSGTAASNYLPAISEARESRIPLIVLTADRPHELRDIGAPQAMNQIGLYGSFVKKFIELALPEASEAMYQYARSSINRLYRSCVTAPMGPVHMNVPLREPLVPNFAIDDLFSAGKRKNSAHTILTKTLATISIETRNEITELFQSKRKGLLVCGPYVEGDALKRIIALGSLLDYPVLCDPLSNGRANNNEDSNVIDTYDTFLRFEDIANSLESEIIVRFGSMPVSKTFTQYTQRQQDCELIVIDEGDLWRDPTLKATQMISCDDLEFCNAIFESYEKTTEFQPDWLNEWKSINEKTKNGLQQAEQFDELFEGKIVQVLAKSIEEESTLFVSNSMPIRDVDTFLLSQSKKLKIACNRGVNGIDGTIATALGMAAAGDNVTLLIGDLSFYHDLNSLVLSKLHHLPLRVILVNNDGGGIFSFLPQSKEEKHFEALFGTPLGLDFEHATALFGGIHTKINNWFDFEDVLSRKNDGLQVIEIRTNRQENYDLHQKVWSIVKSKYEK